MAWLAVFRNSRGGSPGFLEGLGIAVPDWLAYGPVAIIMVMVLLYYAYSYIMVSGTLQTINSELEEMGEIQGANKLQMIRSITLPPGAARRAFRPDHDPFEDPGRLRRAC